MILTKSGGCPPSWGQGRAAGGCGQSQPVMQAGLRLSDLQQLQHRLLHIQSEPLLAAFLLSLNHCWKQVLKRLFPECLLSNEK